VFEAIDYLQKSIDKSQRELQKIQEATDSEDAGLPKIKGILEHDTYGLEAIMDRISGISDTFGEGGDVTNIATTIGSHDDLPAIDGSLHARIAELRAAITHPASGLPKILEHAGNAAASSANALLALTAGADRLEVINEHAGNAAEQASTAVGKLSDDDNGLVAIKGAIGRVNEGPDNNGSVLARMRGLHLTLTTGESSLDTLRMRIGHQGEAADGGGSLHAKMQRANEYIGSSMLPFSLPAIKATIGSSDDTATRDTVFGKVAKVQETIGTPSPLSGVFLFTHQQWLIHGAMRLATDIYNSAEHPLYVRNATERVIQQQLDESDGATTLQQIASRWHWKKGKIDSQSASDNHHAYAITIDQGETLMCAATANSSSTLLLKYGDNTSRLSDIETILGYVPDETDIQDLMSTQDSIAEELTRYKVYEMAFAHGNESMYRVADTYLEKQCRTMGLSFDSLSETMKDKLCARHWVLYTMYNAAKAGVPWTYIIYQRPPTQPADEDPT
jgi:hypothetical protein